MLCIVMSLMVLERMLYRSRMGDNFLSNYKNVIKLSIHFILVITVHAMLTLYWPIH